MPRRAPTVRDAAITHHPHAMPDTPLAVVRRVDAAYARRDMAAIFAELDPAIADAASDAVRDG